MTAEGPRPACIVVENGAIAAIESAAAELGSMPVIDVADLWVLPALVDTHVHVNEPGRSEWEGFATASRAAAAGGCTSLIDMPLNSVPATVNVVALEAKRSAARKTCLVDYAFWGGVVKGNAKDLLPLAEAGVKGFKCFLVHPGIEEFSMVDEHDLHIAMPLIARTGLPLLVHAEHPRVIANASRETHADPLAYSTYLQSRPDEAETRAIELMVRLCREYRCRVHIVHLSSAAPLSLIKRAREEGLPLTVETCPHYLYFAAEQIPNGATQFKCAPPIRDATNRELLWNALRDRTIDLVATDHSPCRPEKKHGDFFSAWGGIASLSLALSVVWTSAKHRGFQMSDIVRWMSEKSAELAGLGAAKGKIAPGYDADFIVFDPNASCVVKSSDLHFRHPVTPYLGEHLEGKVRMTFLRGSLLYQDGNFVDSAPGREV